MLIKLKDVCSIRRGASPRPIDSHLTNDKTAMPWIKISDVTNGGKYIYSTKEYIKKDSKRYSVEIEEGTLIVTNSGSPGIPKISKIKGCVHDGWLILSDFKNINKDFLYYWLLNNQKNLVKQGSGSIFINLKTDILANFEIDLPILETQDKIANILSNIDNQIERNNTMVQKLLLKSMSYFSLNGGLRYDY